MANQSLQDEMRENAVDQRMKENKRAMEIEREEGKGRRVIRALVIIALILILGGFSIHQFVLRPAKKMIAEKITENVLEQALTQAGVTEDVSEKAKEIMDSMSSEDKAKVEKIVDQHASVAEITEAGKIYKSQGTSGLKEYAKENLTEDEMKEIRGFYDKYKDTVLEQ